jgi:proteasome lid subunit RPN8/RPN11
MISIRGTGYNALWALCRATGLKVVADVHTHPGGARQSDTDRRNPMIATRGHIAFIVPNFARCVPTPEALGMYEYLGAHHWADYSGPSVERRFHMGF